MQLNKSIVLNQVFEYFASSMETSSNVGRVAASKANSHQTGMLGFRGSSSALHRVLRVGPWTAVSGIGHVCHVMIVQCNTTMHAIGQILLPLAFCELRVRSRRAKGTRLVQERETGPWTPAYHCGAFFLLLVFRCCHVRPAPTQSARRLNCRDQARPLAK
ncbi:hypothetical protein BCV70DRAFT_197442 [Testicularia cyperi]|uniref:Uncharacterized protein n=1 Tax=Testicularia cyperi TaxID=1882483 RepID=A0A317XZJ9_9BASI|nr:hypothetical protein BCV70DRAFT_197442 [Testicularia cyperi]